MTTMPTVRERAEPVARALVRADQLTVARSGDAYADPALLLGSPVDRSRRTPCQGVDPDWFFADVPEVIEDAKRVCQPCAMRLACLRGAMRRHESHGVWGGELFQNGVIIPRKRPRGRPRTHPQRGSVEAFQPDLAEAA
jgi:WhiB family redox-sensing transcriptional regulator